MKKAFLFVCLGVVALVESRRGLTKGGKDIMKNENEIRIEFVNPYEDSRELVWIAPNGDLTPMGMLSGQYGSTIVTTYIGHDFGWRLPLVEEAESCLNEDCPASFSQDVEGRIQIVARMKSPYIIGTEVESAPAPMYESNVPFEARFINKSPRRTMRLLREKSQELLAELSPGQSISAIIVSRGERLDWLDGDELLFRSVIEYHGQDIHAFEDHEYTRLCSDEKSPTQSLRDFDYYDPIEHRSIRIQVLNEIPLIVLAKNWSLNDQCQSLHEMALQTGLSNAQVFGQRSIVADRRALSANLYWNESDTQALTNHLITRAFIFTKELRGYDIVPGPFQEPLNFIHYSYAEEYRPHCDGVSTRKPYQKGGRVATLLHYCQAAQRGGATVFPKLNLKAQPSPNDAVLFTYKQDDGFMDDGNTLHTGCLVRDGTKSVVTMWMRENITPEEPWSDFLS